MLPISFEFSVLRQVIKRTIANPKGKPYRHLVDMCLAQKTKLVHDIKYDMDVRYDRKTVMSREYIRRIAEKVFHRHGAVFLQGPQLMPKGNLAIYDKVRVYF